MTKKTAVLIDNMYLENLAKNFGVNNIDLVKFSDNLIEVGEERYMTYVFDALPFVPDVDSTDEQIRRRDQKARYLDKLEFLNKITVERGQVRPKKTKC